MNEAVFDTVQKIVKDKQMGKVKFANKKTLDVDTTTASVLVSLDKALSGANRTKFRNNLDKGPNAFMKMVDFAFSAGR